MHDALGMQVHKCLYDLSSIFSCISRSELAFSTNAFKQIATRDVFLHDVYVLLILVVCDVFHNAGMVQRVRHF